MDKGDAALRHYVEVLRRRLIWIIGATVLTAVVAFLASARQTPLYRASASVLVRASVSERAIGSVSDRQGDPVRDIETETQIIQSAPVAQAAREAFGGDLPSIQIEPVGLTDVIRIGAVSPDPKVAAKAATAYADAYISFRHKQTADGLLGVTQEIQQRIDDLQKQIDDIDRQIENASASSRASLAAELGTKRSGLVNLQIGFSNRLQQFGVDASLTSGGAQLITGAGEPTAPFSPQPRKSMTTGGIIGVLLGIGLALFVDRFDESMKTVADVEAASDGLPTLGVIPSFGPDDAAGLVIAGADPASAAAEAYRSLCTSVRLVRRDRAMSVIQVTSPGAGEGKSTTVANLGVTLAEVGVRTIIVCCDLRRPQVHKFFGLKNDLGLASVLLGDAPLSLALQSVKGHPNLKVLASGPTVVSPAQTLSSSRVDELLQSLRDAADVVLLDCPPTLPVTDASVLAPRADGVIIVARANRTRTTSFQRAQTLIAQVGGRLFGTVLNDADRPGAYGYGGAYDGYTYKPISERKTRKRGRDAGNGAAHLASSKR